MRAGRASQDGGSGHNGVDDGYGADGGGAAPARAEGAPLAGLLLPAPSRQVQPLAGGAPHKLAAMADTAAKPGPPPGLDAAMARYARLHACALRAGCDEFEQRFVVVQASGGLGNQLAAVTSAALLALLTDAALLVGADTARVLRAGFAPPWEWELDAARHALPKEGLANKKMLHLAGNLRGPGGDGAASATAVAALDPLLCGDPTDRLGLPPVTIVSSNQWFADAMLLNARLAPRLRQLFGEKGAGAHADASVVMHLLARFLWRANPAVEAAVDALGIDANSVGVHIRRMHYDAPVPLPQVQLFLDCAATAAGTAGTGASTLVVATDNEELRRWAVERGAPPPPPQRAGFNGLDEAPASGGSSDSTRSLSDGADASAGGSVAAGSRAPPPRETLLREQREQAQGGGDVDGWRVVVPAATLDGDVDEAFAAVVDLVALARCGRLVLTSWSTFSYAAAALSPVATHALVTAAPGSTVVAPTAGEVRLHGGMPFLRGDRTVCVRSSVAPCFHHFGFAPLDDLSCMAPWGGAPTATAVDVEEHFARALC